jgi:hypothetical protein
MTMSNINKRPSTSKVGLFSITVLASHLAATVAFASPTGHACRKEICDSAVSACMRSDQALNPIAWTKAEKQAYCAAIFNGCMTRSITPDLPWYSPEMVAQFLQCPP